MDHEARIKELEAALLESMLGAAALVTCVVQSLGEADPSLQARFANNLRRWHGRASNRARPEAKVMAEMVGQTIIDPAFPMSSESPRDG
jgi:hypothetical protein